MSKEQSYRVEYSLAQADGAVVAYGIDIDNDTLVSAVVSPETLPKWTLLENEKCAECPLTESVHCPIAARLAEPVRIFDALVSHMPVRITVSTPERSYMRDGDVQDALRSLFGLIMATSGCPVTRPFRYMARYHLPFATIEETITRITSTYLMRQMLNTPVGEPIKVDLGEIETLYKTLQSLNKNMALRLRSAPSRDGSLNAIVILNTYSSLIPIIIKDELKKLKSLFDY